MASSGDWGLPSREKAAAAASTAAVEEDSRVKGEDTAAMVADAGIPAVREGAGRSTAVEGESQGPEVVMEGVTGGEGRVDDDRMAKETTGDGGGDPVTRDHVGEAEIGGDSSRVDGGTDSTSSRDGMVSSRGEGTGTPLTPTVEELFAAAERAGGEQRDDTSGEVVVGGRVVATPVLRTTAVEPRVGDSGIGASGPVPFAEGDFLDTARPQDILDVLGLDVGVREVLMGARTPEDQASALLLGALLSGAGVSGAGEHGVGTEMEGEVEEREPEAEVVIEERVTAAAKAKAYLGRARPGFTAGTYAPQLHFFEPTGMTGYVPARMDIPRTCSCEIEPRTFLLAGPRYDFNALLSCICLAFPESIVAY
ncbi:hypothetical protein RHMOL_Rhmol08G0166600 [Rhododendron molle]|uniref:Uncharacterized protein n=1 Tax=Rhododendron molle TaxID=49168 RepID=A0ACC0MQB9_RHOML|nr:hypothetical protein RHMOL_Rhmol08G0166600 [Rhododendron molle]